MVRPFMQELNLSFGKENIAAIYPASV